MSQDRIEKTSNTPAQKNTPYQAPDIGDTVSRASQALKKVRVVHGANEQYFDLEGKTVGSVRKSLREVFNIPGDADAIVGNQKVGDDFILEGNTSLEFSKDAGIKGINTLISST